MALLKKLNTKVALSTTAMALVSTVPAFASEPTNTTAYQAVLTSLTSAVSVADVATILGGCVAAGIGFFFLWFGARKAVNSFVTALQSGKIKL